MEALERDGGRERRGARAAFRERKESFRVKRKMGSFRVKREMGSLLGLENKVPPIDLRRMGFGVRRKSTFCNTP